MTYELQWKREGPCLCRHLFDWLVVGQVMPANPASSVRGPSHVVKRGKTPVLSPEEARRVLDAIDVSTHAGLRDRALIALMVFSFARIGAAIAMKVEDVYVQQDRRLWVRLHALRVLAFGAQCFVGLAPIRWCGWSGRCGRRRRRILGLAPRPCEPSGAGRRRARRPVSNP